jgi:hypothetical protein
MRTSVHFLLTIAVLALSLVACGNQDKESVQQTDENAFTPTEVSPKVVFENDYTEAVAWAKNQLEMPHT